MNDFFEKTERWAHCFDASFKDGIIHYTKPTTARGYIGASGPQFTTEQILERERTNKTDSDVIFAVIYNDTDTSNCPVPSDLMIISHYKVRTKNIAPEFLAEKEALDKLNAENAVLEQSRKNQAMEILKEMAERLSFINCPSAENMFFDLDFSYYTLQKSYPEKWYKTSDVYRVLLPWNSPEATKIRETKTQIPYLHI